MDVAVSFGGMLRALVRNRELMFALARREILGRYQGSVMGLLWSFFHPLLMLSVYTFVFSAVFQMRWPGGTGSRAEFALVLFSALIAFNLFAECIGRAPGLIVANANYVTKVVFPLEVLPVVTLMSALFHAGVSLVVWVIFHAIVSGMPPVTVLLLPLVLAPLVFLALGFGWLLASLGVYLRDVSQIISVVTMVLMYVSPIFYPVSAVPERFRGWLQLNPLTTTIEQMRQIMLWGQVPDWKSWAILMASSIAVAWLGFAWFQKTRKGFADVL